MDGTVTFFSRAEARALLPWLRLLTGRTREELEHLWAQLGDTSTPDEIRRAYFRMNALRENWYREVRATGARPRRLREVLFDSGDGYAFTWRFGDEDILFIERARRDRFCFRLPREF